MADVNNHFFLLGGHDLEMLTINELLKAYAPTSFCDKNLSWGAKASDYRIEIDDALHAGKIPVLVELIDDLQLGEKVVIVDHHGSLAGKDRPTSLHQVFDLLMLPKNLWTHHFELVAANDRGYIGEMLECGATQKEIVSYRAKDRAAQGITQEQENQAVAAIADLQVLCHGRLTIVRLPHNHTATVADRLASELGGQGYKNLLVISPAEINFFGPGEMVRNLERQFPGGWYGGSLPERGFWGHAGELPEVIPALIGGAE